jgi:hypothetical protein
MAQFPRITCEGPGPFRHELKKLSTYNPVQDTLGVKSRIILIATVSRAQWFVLPIPGSEFTCDTVCVDVRRLALIFPLVLGCGSNSDETLSTLKFAERFRPLRSKVRLFPSSD